jgi:hypothetical protein
MTSPIPVDPTAPPAASGHEQNSAEARTVRDIVEHQHEQVDEAWCRKIFRKLLQSLELQYAMQMPHRAITADTVVFHDNGEPLLLPSIISDPEPDQAGDLTALARLIHYAITQELAPTGPLHGRGLAGYSASLIAAVDRCMDPDPALRPQSIEELRTMLGVLTPGAAPAPVDLPADLQAPAPTMPTPMPMPMPMPDLPPPHDAAASQPVKASVDSRALPAAPGEQPQRRASRRGLSPWQRWTVAGAGAAILLAIALTGIAELRDSGSSDAVLLTLPPKAEGGQPVDAAAASPATSGTPAATPPASMPADAAANAAPAAAPQDSAEAAPATPAAAAGSASYKLQIQPWGVVYVDDVDRGVSPPVKRLVLAPGRHMIRVTNPNFHERVLELDTAKGDGRIVVDFNAAAE